MKKQVLVVVIALITAVSYGQKREIKKAEKAVKDKDYAEAMTLLAEAEPGLETVDADIKAMYYTTRAEALVATANKDFTKMKMAGEAIQKAIENDPSSKTHLETTIQSLRAALVNSAIEDQKANNYTMASDKLHASFKVSPSDTSDLYYAAGNSVNAKDYDTALSYYNELIDMEFTGIETEYLATNKDNGNVEPFASKNLRDLSVRSGEYIKPETKKSDSKRGEILRNMTLIYIENGEDDKAIALMKTARKENPTDMSLMRADADMAYKMGDKEKYNRIMNEIVTTDPNNPEIYYNLGVGTSELGNAEKAIEYYEKAIELKPDYSAALINIGALRLKDEAAIVEEMNNLGSSRADNARYDELKLKREQLYKETLPYFEKAAQLEPKNVGLARTLMNIYSQVGDDENFDVMKAKVAELESSN